jgi:EAL domain-containing protein (putative c-di-GMP-specific phosphodiesterase class I)
MDLLPCPATPKDRCYLEHFPAAGGLLQRVLLPWSPFRLGRDNSADLVIYCSRVSKVHAEIVPGNEEMILRDLRSTNGTFVNGRRIHDYTALFNGDIIHLAEKEFRFASEASGELEPNEIVEATESALITGMRSVIQDTVALRELIDQGQVVARFQPIVTLANRRVVGYEALGRSRHATLPVSPGPLLALAEKLKMAAPVSRAFRRVALADCARLPRPHALFLNLHPDELLEDNLMKALDELPEERLPGQTLVVEIHEDTAADTPFLARLRSRLSQMNIRLAYDDFGAGRGRLAALAEVPVDYVKLDRALVQGMPLSSAMRELVRALARVCAGLGTQLLAEGLETEQQAVICQEQGCQLGQGYLFGHPAPVTELV